MSSFTLRHLDRNVISLANSTGIAIQNLTAEPVSVFVDVKRGAAWTPWSGRVTLSPGERWWAERGQVPAEQVCVVVAHGAGNGRCVVRVEY